jgi:hypothetical protein
MVLKQNAMLAMLRLQNCAQSCFVKVAFPQQEAPTT